MPDFEAAQFVNLHLNEDGDQVSRESQTYAAARFAGHKAAVEAYVDALAAGNETITIDACYTKVYQLHSIVLADGRVLPRAASDLGRERLLKERAEPSTSDEQAA